MSAADLTAHLSGGGDNTDPALSTGGGIALDAPLVSQAATGSLPGVTVVDGYGNAVGDGTLSYSVAGQSLTWAAPGDSAGAAVDVSAGGRFRLPSATAGELVVEVDLVLLPVADDTATVTITNLYRTLFSDVTTAEALLGNTEYRCFYLRNDSAAAIDDAVLWLVTGQTSEFVSVRVAVGAVDTQAVLTTDGVAPSGVVFTSTPTSTAPYAIGPIPAGSYVPIWLERTIATGTTLQTNDATLTLWVSAPVSGQFFALCSRFSVQYQQSSNVQLDPSFGAGLNQLRYLCTLRRSGLPDLAVKTASIQIRLAYQDATQALSACTVSVPAYSAVEAELLPRLASGTTLAITMQALMRDGSVTEASLVECAYSDAQINQGPRNRTLSITGLSYAPPTSDAEFVPAGVQTYNTNLVDQGTLRCNPQFGLSVGMTVLWDGHYWRAQELVYNIGVDSAYMDITLRS